MATDYNADIAKYAAKVDDKIVAGIVKHLGIALKGVDSSLVSCADKGELERVRESFLKKKLALTQSDADLDKAIQAVCKQMDKDKTKQRVTFYYLLTEKFGKGAALSK